MSKGFEFYEQEKRRQILEARQARSAWLKQKSNREDEASIHEPPQDQSEREDETSIHEPLQAQSDRHGETSIHEPQQAQSDKHDETKIREQRQNQSTKEVTPMVTGDLPEHMMPFEDFVSQFQPPPQWQISSLPNDRPNRKSWRRDRLPALRKLLQFEQIFRSKH